MFLTHIFGYTAFLGFSRSYPKIESICLINRKVQLKKVFSHVIFVQVFDQNRKHEGRDLTLLYCGRTVRSSHRRCSIEKVVFKNSAIRKGNNCAGVFLKKIAGLKAPTQVFSCEYCEIFKNIYFEKHLRTAAFDCFNSSLPHEPKVSRSRLYDGLKLQGLQVFSGSSGRHLTS